MFAYELRKQDRHNRYTFKILDLYVGSPVLVKIIMANIWNPKESRMEFDQDQITIKILKNRQEVLCYHSKHGGKDETTLTVKPVNL